MDIQSIQGRSDLLANMRAWFRQKQYLEVATPTLSPDLIPESTIENFATQYINEFLGSRELYLIPSPEIHMKKIIAEIKRSIYQFSSCFRNCEQVGSHHNPEFTMLEYYTVGADEQDSIAITEDLIAHTALDSCPEHILSPFRKMSMAEACHTYAGFDLDANQSISRLRQTALGLGLHLPDAQESWESTFNRIFLTFVEPALPQDRPLVLDEYPQQIVCLAKRTPGRPYRQRWELYAGGIEVANCYNEELDANTIRAYYRNEYAHLATQRNLSGTVIPDCDHHFADIFDSTYPACSGVAMGMDRLLMLQLGRADLGGVILFPLSAMITAGCDV